MSPRVIGVGNAIRGDDAVGLAVIDELRRRNAPLDLVTSDGDPGQLLELLDGVDVVVIVDAVVSDARPGALHVRDLTAGSVPFCSATSSHGVGLAQAIELARLFRQLPKETWLVGVEGASFEPGAVMTPEVTAAVGPAADTIQRGGFRCTNGR